MDPVPRDAGEPLFARAAIPAARVGPSATPPVGTHPSGWMFHALKPARLEAAATRRSAAQSLRNARTPGRKNAPEDSRPESECTQVKLRLEWTRETGGPGRAFHLWSSILTVSAFREHTWAPVSRVKPGEAPYRAKHLEPDPNR